MSRYRVSLEREAERALRRLPTDVADRALSRILRLANEPRPVGTKKLKDHKNDYRIRMGNYRIVFRR